MLSDNLLTLLIRLRLGQPTFRHAQLSSQSYAPCLANHQSCMFLANRNTCVTRPMWALRIVACGFRMPGCNAEAVFCSGCRAVEQPGGWMESTYMLHVYCIVAYYDYCITL